LFNEIKRVAFCYWIKKVKLYSMLYSIKQEKTLKCFIPNKFLVVIIIIKKIINAVSLNINNDWLHDDKYFETFINCYKYYKMIFFSNIWVLNLS